MVNPPTNESPPRREAAELAKMREPLDPHEKPPGEPYMGRTLAEGLARVRAGNESDGIARGGVEPGTRSASVAGANNETAERTLPRAVPSDDPVDPWTNFPIVYDRAIGGGGDSVRLELDSIGQVRMTYTIGEHVTTIYSDDEKLRDMAHLILRGLNHLAIENRTGWAA